MFKHSVLVVEKEVKHKTERDGDEVNEDNEIQEDSKVDAGEYVVEGDNNDKNIEIHDYEKNIMIEEGLNNPIHEPVSVTTVHNDTIELTVSPEDVKSLLGDDDDSLKMKAVTQELKKKVDINGTLD